MDSNSNDASCFATANSINNDSNNNDDNEDDEDYSNDDESNFVRTTPTTPKISSPYVDGSVRDVAVQLAVAVVVHVTSSTPEVTSCRHGVTMLRVVGELLTKNAEQMREMADQVLAGCENGDRSARCVSTAYAGVVRQMYADSRYSWGRLAAVYAFAGCVAARWRCLADRHGGGGAATDSATGNRAAGSTEAEHQLDATLVEYGRLVGRVIAERLGPWIEKQGGWDEFERFFERPDELTRPEGGGLLWRGLMAAVVEIGTTAIVGVH